MMGSCISAWVVVPKAGKQVIEMITEEMIVASWGRQIPYLLIPVPNQRNYYPRVILPKPYWNLSFELLPLVAIIQPKHPGIFFWYSIKDST